MTNPDDSGQGTVHRPGSETRSVESVFELMRQSTPELRRTLNETVGVERTVEETTRGNANSMSKWEMAQIVLRFREVREE